MKLPRLTNHLHRHNEPAQEIPAPASSVAPNVPILDLYLESAPSPQNALNIFQGEWSSKLPAPFAQYQAGSTPLFEDIRIQWFVDTIGGIQGKTILELGPLEGGHTYMLEKLHASRIVAIEANTRAFLKCLIVKELLGLQQTHFLCGNFTEYLRQEGENFQICLASGVLYHMQTPAELIALLARRCSEYLFVWTHYYEPTIILANPVLSPKFIGSIDSKYEGFRHTLHQQEYQSALDWKGFCGGTAPTSCWMTRDDIIRCIEHFGFAIQAVNFDYPEHPNGPAMAFVAKRRTTRKVSHTLMRLLSKFSRATRQNLS